MFTATCTFLFASMTYTYTVHVHNAMYHIYDIRYKSVVVSILPVSELKKHPFSV